MTAHALLIALDRDRLTGPRVVDALDALVSASLRNSQELDEPRALAPLPVLGVPGWWRDTEREEFYDDIAYFRPGRARRNRRGMTRARRTRQVLASAKVRPLATVTRFLPAVLLE